MESDATRWAIGKDKDQEQPERADDSSYQRKDGNDNMSKRSYWERWKKTTIANQALVITGTLMFISSGIYTGATVFQVMMWRENARQTGEQSARLIAASERMADVANRQAEDSRKANTEMLSKSERMTRANEELVKAATKQASTSQVSARAAEVSAKFAGKTVEATREATFTTNRAYVTVRKIHPPALSTNTFPIVIDWDNDGNSPGRIIEGQVSLMVRSHAPTWKECAPAGGGFQGLVVQPRSTRTQHFNFPAGGLTQDEVAAVGSGQRILVICGRFSYETLGQRMPLTFCTWDKEVKNYLNCKEGDEK